MKQPILMTYETWANSQLSIARHTGGVKIFGVFYMIISEYSNRYTPDLLRYDWVPVYNKLGREKSGKLIYLSALMYLEDQADLCEKRYNEYGYDEGQVTVTIPEETRFKWREWKKETRNWRNNNADHRYQSEKTV